MTNATGFKTVVSHGPSCGEVYDVVCEDYRGGLCRDAALEFHRSQVDVYGLDPDQEWWCAFDLGDCDGTIDTVADGLGWVKLGG